MMDTRNPLQPVHSTIFLAREGPSFVSLLSHTRPCNILVLTASWDLLFIITPGKAQYLGGFWESRGVHSEYNWLQTRANVHPAQSQTMGHRDRGSDLRRGGAHSRPRPTSVVATTRARARHAPLHVVSRLHAGRRRRQIPQQNCRVQHCVWYNPKKKTTNSVTDSLPQHVIAILSQVMAPFHCVMSTWDWNGAFIAWFCCIHGRCCQAAELEYHSTLASLETTVAPFQVCH
jgi:hypothetical protein